MFSISSSEIRAYHRALLFYARRGVVLQINYLFEEKAATEEEINLFIYGTVEGLCTHQEKPAESAHSADGFFAGSWMDPFCAKVREIKDQKNICETYYGTWKEENCASINDTGNTTDTQLECESTTSLQQRSDDEKPAWLQYQVPIRHNHDMLHILENSWKAQCLLDIPKSTYLRQLSP